ncbi:hypothetical protein GA0070624_5407 [Micromonospora rhizosphaerae]|uniref:Uncharacterized protein n=1 Tax=Micromonospora rhizosphaerae TaxID=568872 RepID=A0A1C6T2G4_9ACTN|nr:hypothetical protein [Micromonospora rhizosphaerae]SCL35941.1 hypothetical protein GA0070624_5407 [Micromonospora rhizosphaerae]
MLRSLISSVRPRHLAVTAAIYLPLAALMFGSWPASLMAVSRACAGLPPFDVRAWWTMQDARTMLTACGPAGRIAYIHQQLLDLAYPAALAALLLVATALLVRRYGDRWWPFLLPTVAMTVLDYVENIGVWTLLLDWPDTHPAIITVAGTATAVKRVLGFIAFTTPLLLAPLVLASAIYERRGRPAAVAPATDTDTSEPPPPAPAAS